MATEITELTFDNVDLKALATLLMELSKSSVLSEYNIATDEIDVKINFYSKSELIKIIANPSYGAFFFYFSKFKISKYYLPNVLLQIIKYEDKYDVNIIFDEDSIASIISISILHKWAMRVALKLHAEDFYCGMDPACDIETRFFTGNVMGPLVLSKF